MIDNSKQSEVVPSKTVSHDWLKRLYIELVNLATAPNGTTFPSWILHGKEFGELRRVSQESPDETTAPLTFSYATCNSGGGEKPTVTMGFETLSEAQSMHGWLIRSQRSAVEPAGKLLHDEECENCGAGWSKHLTNKLICPDAAIQDVYRFRQKMAPENGKGDV